MLGKGRSLIAVASALLALGLLPASSHAVQYVEKAASSPTQSAVQVACPAGTHVTGGGAITSNGYRNLVLRGSFPYDNNDGDLDFDDGWRIHYQNRGGSGVSVEAICAADMPVYAFAGFSIPAGARGEQTLECPGDDHVYSGGARGATLVGLLPRDGSDADARTDDRWLARLDNYTQQSALAGVWVICGETLPRYPTTTAPVPAHSESNEIDAVCPAGLSVIGGGSGISAPYRKGLINSLAHYEASDSTWYSYLDNVDATAHQARVTATCAGL